MIAYYLNAADGAGMRAALTEAGVATEQDGQLIPAVGVILDEIGLWFEATSQTTTDADGNTVPVMQQVPGWYFNVYADREITWPASMTVAQPVTPWRILG